MLSSCWISGGAVSDRICNRPITSIRRLRSWLHSLEPARHGGEGVDRSRCLPAHGQDRRAVSGSVAVREALGATWRPSAGPAPPRNRRRFRPAASLAFNRIPTWVVGEGAFLCAPSRSLPRHSGPRRHNPKIGGQKRWKLLPVSVA